MNLSTQKRQTQGHGEQICGCSEGGGREWDTLRVWGQQMQTIAFGVNKQSDSADSAQGTIYDHL